MKNDSFIVEKYYDDLYERSENISQRECPECSGSGFEYYSDCCGSEISDGKCTDCNNKCEIVSGVCRHCEGEGMI